MIVRPAGQDDAPGIATVHVRSWQAAYRGLLPQDFLDGMVVSVERVDRWRTILGADAAAGRTTFVATSDAAGADIVLGFAHVAPSRDDDADATTAELIAIYALPDAFGTGAGRTLMRAGLDWLAAAGYTQATLWVLVGNARAIRFYEAAGWRYEGTSKTDELAGITVTERRYRRALP
jgi:GNAT superfamily N-acetyltransferase